MLADLANKKYFCFTLFNGHPARRLSILSKQTDNPNSLFCNTVTVTSAVVLRAIIPFELLFKFRPLAGKRSKLYFRSWQILFAVFVSFASFVRNFPNFNLVSNLCGREFNLANPNGAIQFMRLLKLNHAEKNFAHNQQQPPVANLRNLE